MRATRRNRGRVTGDPEPAKAGDSLDPDIGWLKVDETTRTPEGADFVSELSCDATLTLGDGERAPRY